MNTNKTTPTQRRAYPPYRGVLSEAVQDMIKEMPDPKVLRDAMDAKPIQDPVSAAGTVFDKALPHFLTGLRILTGADEMEERLLRLEKERDQALETIGALKRMNDSLADSHKLVHKKLERMTGDMDKLRESTSNELKSLRKSIEELPKPQAPVKTFSKEELQEFIRHEIDHIFGPSGEETKKATNTNTALVEWPAENPEPFTAEDKKAPGKNMSFTVPGDDTVYYLHDVEKALLALNNGEALKSFSVCVLGLQTPQANAIRKTFKNLPISIESIEKTTSFDSSRVKSYDMVAVSRFVSHQVWKGTSVANPRSLFILGGVTMISQSILGWFIRDHFPQFLNKA